MKMSFSVLNYVIKICLKLQTNTLISLQFFWSNNLYPSVKDFKLLRITKKLEQSS